MRTRIPSEAAIAHEMERTGLDRLQSIRRIQQRGALLASRAPDGAPLFFIQVGGEQ